MQVDRDNYVLTSACMKRMVKRQLIKIITFLFDCKRLRSNVKLTTDSLVIV